MRIHLSQTKWIFNVWFSKENTDNGFISIFYSVFTRYTNNCYTMILSISQYRRVNKYNSKNADKDLL